MEPDSPCKRPRFEARRMTPATFVYKEPDPNVETMIYSTATCFPYNNFQFPSVSKFCPCAAVLLYYLQHMDCTMASNENWTDNCMGWVPPYSMIYISVLFYIQVLRAMDVAGAPLISSELNFLRGFMIHFPPENLSVPGPLVQFFKNLACFWPSDDGLYGNVTPAIPTSPGWSRQTSYCFDPIYANHLPNISLFISRLRTVCATATKDLMNQHDFFNDVDGPLYCATLFGQRCNHDKHEIANMRSPGANFVFSGSLELWQNAADRLDYTSMPSDLDVSENNVADTWASALRMDTSDSWFGPLSIMMAKYCQFWKGSSSLADCPPNCSPAGGVKCTVEAGTSLFDDPKWSAFGENGNKLGHYVLYNNRKLIFNAITTVNSIPLPYWHAAITYCPNLLINEGDAENLLKGPFWAATPDVHGHTGINVLHGVLYSIRRHFHSDVRLYPVYN